MFVKLYEKIINKINNIKGYDKPFDAEFAWFETTYGKSSYKPIELRIKEKQNEVKEDIKDCFFISDSNVKKKNYHIFFRLETDLIEHSKEIFQPFIEKNFNITFLDEKIDDLKGEGLYLISWKHIYQ